jgi:hypothetical protein
MNFGNLHNPSPSLPATPIKPHKPISGPFDKALIKDMENILHFPFPKFTKVVYPSRNFGVETLRNTIDLASGPFVEFGLAYDLCNLFLTLLNYGTIVP